MSRYITHRVSVSQGQKDKIKKAIQKGDDNITIRLGYEDLIGGNDIIALTKTQINAINKAVASQKGTTISMSTAQLNANKKVEGGFIGTLIGLASRFLPTILGSLGMGALSGAASAGVQKAIGSGLYLRKGGHAYSVQPSGSGLYLNKVNGSGLPSGDGYYLKKGPQLQVIGKGLLLGPNSPFKNIPLLGMIL